MIGIIDIEIYDLKKDKNAQMKYLIHGYKDSFWTNNLNEVTKIIKENIKKIISEKSYKCNSKCSNCSK